jgi:phosphoribosylanthranilate isomerase
MENKVIAGPITNLTDARYFAARGVWAIFFDIREGSPEGLSSHEALAIKEWVDLENIGLLVPVQDWEESEWLASNLGVDFLVAEKLEGPMDREKSRIPLYWKGKPSELLSLAHPGGFDGFLVESFQPEEIEWLENRGLLGRCFLSLSQEELDFEKIYSKYQGKTAWWLRGGEEEKVGFKSFEDLDLMLDKLESDDF